MTVIERESADHHGCSWGNAGLLVPSHFVPLAAPGMVGMGIRMMFDPSGPFAFNLLGDKYLAGWAKQFMGFANARHVDRSAPILRDLNLLSKQCYVELSKEWGDGFGLDRSGLMVVCESEETLRHESEIVEVAHGLGLGAEVWDGDKIGSEEPGLEIRAAGAVYFKDDGMLTPGPFLAKLREEVMAGGGTILSGTEATGFRVEHGLMKAVRTSGEEVEGDEFVLAAGSWSRDLATMVGLEIPMVPGKGNSFTVTQPPAKMRRPMLLQEARVAVTPMMHGVRFAGTMELGSWGEKPNMRRVGGMRKSISRVMPQFRREVLDKSEDLWAGLRPCSPDGLPIVGRVGPDANLTVATGHAMMGLSLGPATGLLVSQVLSGADTALPLRAFSPHRF